MENDLIPGPSDDEMEVVMECERLIDRADFVIAVRAVPEDLQAQIDLGERAYMQRSASRGSMANGWFQGKRLILL